MGTGSPTRTAPSAPSTTLTSFLASRVLYPAVHLPQSGASCPPHPINCRGDAPPAIDTYGEYYSYSYEGGDTCTACSSLPPARALATAAALARAAYRRAGPYV